MRRLIIENSSIFVMLQSHIRSWGYTVVIFLALLPFLLRNNSSEVALLSRLLQHVQQRKINIPITLRFGDSGFKFTDLVRAAQIQVDHELDLSNATFSVTLLDGLNSKNQSSTGLTAELILSNENTIALDPDLLTVYIFYDLAAIHANDLPFFIAQTVVYHLMSAEMEISKRLFNEQFTYTSSKTVNFINVYSDGEVFHEVDLEGAFANFTRAIHPFTNITTNKFTIDSKLLNHSLPQVNDSDLNFFYSSSNTTSIPAQIRSHVKSCAPSQSVESCLEEFITESVQSVGKALGLPTNPSNNLKMRMSSVCRFNTVHGLVASIRNMESTTATSSDPYYKALIPDLHELLEEVYQLEFGHTEWLNLLAKSYAVFQRTKILAQ